MYARYAAKCKRKVTKTLKGNICSCACLHVCQFDKETEKGSKRKLRPHDERRGTEKQHALECQAAVLYLMRPAVESPV